jgi:hypothetical protein
MRVAIVTQEYPPDVYGGAGVHVDFVVRELRKQSGWDAVARRTVEVYASVRR